VHRIKTLIKPLSECSDFAPILAFWSYRQWYKNRPVPFEAVVKSYIERAKNSTLPVSFVAIEDSLPAGMISLKKDDMWSREDINPWLASLYVLPDFRGKGMGKMLIDTVIEQSKNLGLQKIFLFLGQSEQKTLEKYYLKLNWQFYENGVDNDGKQTKIYFYDL